MAEVANRPSRKTRHRKALIRRNLNSRSRTFTRMMMKMKIRSMILSTHSTIAMTINRLQRREDHMALRKYQARRAVTSSRHQISLKLHPIKPKRL
jgi:hypothetical protein